jgi:hypothetical protein
MQIPTAPAYKPLPQDPRKVKDEGLSVEEAKAAMVAAGEAPRGVVAGTQHEAQAFTQPARPTSARLTVLNEDGTDGQSEVITGTSPGDLNRQIAVIHHKATRSGVRVRVELL